MSIDKDDRKNYVPLQYMPLFKTDSFSIESFGFQIFLKKNKTIMHVCEAKMLLQKLYIKPVYNLIYLRFFHKKSKLNKLYSYITFYYYCSQHKLHVFVKIILYSLHFIDRLRVNSG